MENFLYDCVYDVLRYTYPHGQKMIILNLLKAKITSLYGKNAASNVRKYETNRLR